ncbi:MAG: DUF308 domain-containing protein [Ruminococcus sp.]|nr:DUF308 domain-containing protein [Candidatus Apopatosoma intestinale]
MTVFKKSCWSILALSLVSIVSGVFFLIDPGKMFNLICTLIGITALLIGAYQLLYFFIRKDRPFSLIFVFLAGAFCLVCGIILLLHPHFIKTAFPTIIGIAVILGAGAKLFTSFELKHADYPAWIEVFLVAAVALVLGFYMLLKPDKTADFFWRIMGILLIVEGIQNAWTTILSVSAVKKAEKMNVTFTEIATDASESRQLGEADDEKTSE